MFGKNRYLEYKGLIHESLASFQSLRDHLRASFACLRDRDAASNVTIPRDEDDEDDSKRRFRQRNTPPIDYKRLTTPLTVPPAAFLDLCPLIFDLMTRRDAWNYNETREGVM